MSLIELPLLALESSTPIGSVAVGVKGQILAELTVGVRSRHSSSLLPAADESIKAAGLRPRDLGGVVVGGGPGSFTGIRIAGATAKGIAAALGVPLYAYSSLLVVAAQAWAAPGDVCAVFDARGRDVYTATYRFRRADSSAQMPSSGGERLTSMYDLEVVTAPAASTLDELLVRFSGSRNVTFVGDGSSRHAEEIATRLGAAVAPAALGIPRASALLWLAAAYPNRGLVEEPAGWQPEYVRASGAERIAANRGA